MIIYKQELQRKLIHLSSLWIVFALYYLEFSLFTKILYMITVTVLSWDLLRNYNKYAKDISNRFIGGLLRDHERNDLKLTGASFTLIAACICCNFFSVIITIFSLSVLIISDSFAAIIGKHFGKNKICGKTLEGCFAFIISGIIVALFIYYQFSLGCLWLISAIIAVIIAALVELFSTKIKIDDNLTIPLSVAITMKLVILLGQ